MFLGTVLDFFCGDLENFFSLSKGCLGNFGRTYFLICALSKVNLRHLRHIYVRNYPLSTPIAEYFRGKMIAIYSVAALCKADIWPKTKVFTKYAVSGIGGFGGKKNLALEKNVCREPESTEITSKTDTPRDSDPQITQKGFDALFWKPFQALGCKSAPKGDNGCRRKGRRNTMGHHGAT